MDDIDYDPLKKRGDPHPVQSGEEVEHPERSPTYQMEEDDALDHLGNLSIPRRILS